MLSTIDHRDPGDETLQRYRYQHAYGAMLALGALRGAGAFEYVSIYCEHHEDLLGVLPGGEVHAFQVKTRKKELGYWMLSDSAFVHSIQRFVDLHGAHGADIGRFSFVSNVEPRDVDGDGDAKGRTKATSPKLLLESCRTCDDPSILSSGVADGFEGLRAACNCDSATLLSVLRRTDFVLGPDLLGFESELVADVLPAHSACTHLSASQLRRLTRELIELFTHASSLPVDPNARVLPAEVVKRGVTTSEAKQVPVSAVAELLARAQAKGRASYAGLAGDLSLSTLGDGHQVLVQKLRAGELDEQIPNMQRRLLSTFEWVREQQIIDAEAASTTLRQLEGVVEGVYADEQALVSLDAPPWGKRLYGQMLQEFRRLAAADPQKVCNQDHERLFGVAGLLAEHCRIWWSPPFDVEAAS